MHSDYIAEENKKLGTTESRCRLMQSTCENSDVKTLKLFHLVSEIGELLANDSSK